ncbi:reticulon-3 isoform X3 [Hippocampus comes]|uniref:reticulon-3 isoform X3 n=1 Tax=Hippocampus comes TaxID=109280 RepID=UPI00094E2E7C|nr:PREDICTED: reticulon-3 isoform X3 [Hippocampus comes]
MDPMTQSAQISSSQGLADGQNSALKEPRPSDSFLSSSPVALIQSSQDVKTVLGSSRPREGVATTLRFSSQPGSISPDHYGGEAESESLIKMSPVSERIKALEALVAKKEMDFRNDCSSHHKVRHHDKSPSDVAKPHKRCVEENTPTVPTKRGSPDQESPESPFEVLGELRQIEFEETEAWMKAHRPPVPDLHAAGFVKGAGSSEFNPTLENPAFATPSGLPDAFVDSSHDPPKLKEPQEGTCAGQADFDHNFLPTADMWAQQDNCGVQVSPELDSAQPALPLPLSGFESPCPPDEGILDAPDDKRTTWTGDLEPVEAREVDSSGESDETVIEDDFTPDIPSPKSEPPLDDIISSPAVSFPDAERVTPPVRSERKLMQVPTINVIETEEPNCSDDEMEIEFEEEDEEVVNEGPKTADSAPEDGHEAPNRRPVETEFIEGYSPPSSPVESDDERNPPEKILSPQPDAFLEKVEPNESGFDLFPEQPEQSKTAPCSLIDGSKDIHTPGNEEEWSDEARQNIAGQDQADVDPARCAPQCEKDLAVFSRTSFMRGDTYEGQSFEYDESSSPFCENELMTKGAKDDFLSGSAQIDTPTQDALPNRDKANASAGRHFAGDPSDVSDATVPENISASEPVDSFVEFMRECLKSREGEEPDDSQSVPSDDEDGLQSTPIVSMDMEEEQPTISPPKQLGSSQVAEEETPPPRSKTPENENAACIQQASVTPLTSVPCSQSNILGTDCTYSEAVDAVDLWVAEASHLAEHVLMAILTHVSVKDLIHWRDPKKSGLVFGLSMLVLLSLAAFSVISVVSYLLLALLCVTITFRIYKSVVQAVQKSSDGHPFKSLIDKDVSIPPETFRKHVDTSLAYINRALKQMSRLFLVEDLVDSLKLAVVMWLLTYVGAVFNGITILILADILLFAVPPIYEKNKTQIDHYVDLARTQINTTIAKLQEKLPGAVKRSKTE